MRAGWLDQPLNNDEHLIQGGTAWPLGRLSSDHDVRLEPSISVLLAWLLFLLLCAACVYFMIEAASVPSGARSFHYVFSICAILCSVSYAIEAKGLEATMSHSNLFGVKCPWDDAAGFTGGLGWRLPICAAFPHDILQGVWQTLLIFSLSWLAGTPREESIYVTSCSAIMNTLEVVATVVITSNDMTYRYISFGFYTLRCILVIPLLYYLLNGVNQHIETAPLRVKYAVQAWSAVTVITDAVDLVVWGIAYGSSVVPAEAIFVVKAMLDILMVVVLPVSILRDDCVIMLVYEREMLLSKKSHTSHTAVYESHPDIMSHMYMGSGGGIYGDPSKYVEGRAQVKSGPIIRYPYKSVEWDRDRRDMDTTATLHLDESCSSLEGLGFDGSCTLAGGSSFSNKSILL